MSKEEVFNILYGKEKWDVWRKFQDIENSIEESEMLYEYFEDIKKSCMMKNHILKCVDLELSVSYLNGIKITK